MKKKIFALLMAMVLVLGMSTTALADINSPVVDNTPEINSPTGDNEPEIPEVRELTVQWSKTSPWTVEIENIFAGEVDGGYDVYLMKGNTQVGWCPVAASEGDKITSDVSSCVGVYGEGEYWVSVYTYYNGCDYAGSTDERTYTKPATQLAVPANLTFNKDTDIVSFSQVEGAAAYEIWYFTERGGVNSGEFLLLRVEDDNTSDGKVEHVFEGLAEEIDGTIAYFKKEGIDVTIKIGVCAASSDIDKAAYSEFTKCVIGENKLSKEQAKEKLDEAFENVEENPDAALVALEQVSNDTISEMLKTDAEFAKQVERLDAILIEDFGDGYKGTTSKTELVDASKVEVVGLAINAAGENADTVELSFAKPKKEATVPEGYEKGVQLDISIITDGYAIEDLSVPVTITMPIPAGVEKENLVILHYHGDAKEPVVIVPTVNVDGTMTFIVEGFSTFVIANQVVEAPEAPKTGDTSGTALVCSLLFLAAGVVLISKRKSFVK